ncbi:MAG: J domain-containing protein [Desulfotomaculales bacterium]
MEKAAKEQVNSSYGFRDSFIAWAARFFLKLQPVWGTLFGLALAALTAHGWLFYLGVLTDIASFFWQKGVIIGFEEGAAEGAAQAQEARSKAEGSRDRPLTVTEAMVILGLQPGFSLDDVRRAYREKTKIFHPDAGGGHEFFLLLQRAKELLEKELAKNGTNGQ